MPWDLIGFKKRNVGIPSLGVPRDCKKQQQSINPVFDSNMFYQLMFLCMCLRVHCTHTKLIRFQRKSLDYPCYSTSFLDPFWSP